MLHTLCCEEEDFQRARTEWERCAAEEPVFDEAVWFRDLDEPAIAQYVASGEGRDKAGSYAIQGTGAFIVARIDGSHSNVIGLPLCEVVTALQRHQLLPALPIDVSS